MGLFDIYRGLIKDCPGVKFDVPNPDVLFDNEERVLKADMLKMVTELLTQMGVTMHADLTFDFGQRWAT